MRIYFSLYIVAKTTDPWVFFRRLQVRCWESTALPASPSQKQKVSAWLVLICGNSFVATLFFFFPLPFIVPSAHGHIPQPKQISNRREKHRGGTQHKTSCGAKWGLFIIANWFREVNAYADLSVAKTTGVLGLILIYRPSTLMGVSAPGPCSLPLLGTDLCRNVRTSQVQF